MTQRSPFAVAERTAVDWLEANGLEVIERDHEWFLVFDDQEWSVTEMVCAIVRDLSQNAQ